jgi:hypothetical protein
VMLPSPGRNWNVTIAAGAMEGSVVLRKQASRSDQRELFRGDERRRMELGGQWHAAAGVVLRVESGVCSVGEVCCGGMESESWQHGRSFWQDRRLCSMVG